MCCLSYHPISWYLFKACLKLQALELRKMFQFLSYAFETLSERTMSYSIRWSKPVNRFKFNSSSRERIFSRRSVKCVSQDAPGTSEGSHFSKKCNRISLYDSHNCDFRDLSWRFCIAQFHQRIKSFTWAFHGPSQFTIWVIECAYTTDTNS